MEVRPLGALFVLLALLPAIASVVRGHRRRDPPQKLVRHAIPQTTWAFLVLVLILPRASLGSRVAFVGGLLVVLWSVLDVLMDIRNGRRMKSGDPPGS